MLPHVLGDANLKVNVSVELTGETFHTDLTTVVSELFNNKSHWIEAQVCTRVSHLLPINRLTKNSQKRPRLILYLLNAVR